jgi:hypothetical protein
MTHEANDLAKSRVPSSETEFEPPSQAEEKPDSSSSPIAKYQGAEEEEIKPRISSDNTVTSVRDTRAAAPLPPPPRLEASSSKPSASHVRSTENSTTPLARPPLSDKTPRINSKTVGKSKLAQPLVGTPSSGWISTRRPKPFEGGNNSGRRLREIDFDQEPPRKMVKVENESPLSRARGVRLPKKEAEEDFEPIAVNQVKREPSSGSLHGVRRYAEGEHEGNCPAGELEDGEGDEAKAAIQRAATRSIQSTSSEEFPGQKFMRKVHKRRRETVGPDHLKYKGHGAYAKSLPRCVCGKPCFVCFFFTPPLREFFFSSFFADRTSRRSVIVSRSIQIGTVG